MRSPAGPRPWIGIFALLVFLPPAARAGDPPPAPAGEREASPTAAGHTPPADPPETERASGASADPAADGEGTERSEGESGEKGREEAPGASEPGATARAESGEGSRAGQSAEQTAAGGGTGRAAGETKERAGGRKGASASEGGSSASGGGRPSAPAAGGPPTGAPCATDDPPAAALEARTTADEWLEREVARLRAQLEALAGGGEPLVRLVEDSQEFDWTRLGVDEETARELGALESEVVALRARLRLLELEESGRGGATSLPTASDLEERELLAAPAVGETESGEGEGGEAGGAIPEGEEDVAKRSRFPEREAVLAFLLGRYAEVVDLLGPFELERLGDRPLYALGSSLDRLGRTAAARRAFEELAGREGEDLLRLAARRQIDRLDHLEHGVVDLGALLKEGIER